MGFREETDKIKNVKLQNNNEEWGIKWTNIKSLNLLAHWVRYREIDKREYTINLKPIAMSYILRRKTWQRMIRL